MSGKADRRRCPRFALLGAALAALVLLPAAPAAAKLALEVPTRAIEPGANAGPIVDAVTDVREPADALGAAAEASGRASASATATTASFPTADGLSVTVTVSAAYSFDRDAARGYVDLLEGLLHDTELGRLSVYIATPESITNICGIVGAVACYDPGAETMFIPGSQTPGDPWQSLVIAHEYGHHVANHRRNDPWDALAWGTKRWNTYEGVCSGVGAQRLFPGSLEHYLENPGEAFAQAYAYYHFRDAGPWYWTADLAPDEGAFTAIRRDVIHPWRGNAVRRWSGRLLRGRSRVKGRDFSTPLDGRVHVRLTGPRWANYDLALLDAQSGEVLARSRHAGATESLSYTDCGRRSLRIRLYRRSSHGGRFQAVLFRP